MGIGSKIKKVLTDEEPRRSHHGTEPHKGHGGYPNEDVPRSFNRIDKYGNNIVDPRATGAGAAGGNDSLPGRQSADYTYGSPSAAGGAGGPAGGAGTMGRHSHEIPGSQREPGLTRKGLPSQTGAVGSNGGNVLRKGQAQQQQDPYWGDAERRTGAGGGAGNFDNRSPSSMPASEINQRYNNIPPGDGMGSTGGRQETMFGNMPSSGMAGAGAGGMAGSGLTSNLSGGGGGMPGSGAPGRSEYSTPMNTTMPPGGGGQRPMESGNTFRDEVPMNNSGRGMGGVGAGVGAGAPAGPGASQMANRHQEQELGGGGTPRYGNSQYVSRLDPGSPNKMGTPGPGASMLDPYGAPGQQQGNGQVASMGNEMPIRLRDDVPPGQGQGMTDSSPQQVRNQASRNSMGTGSPTQASGGMGNMRSSNETPLGGRQSLNNMRDSGFEDGANRGSSQYGLRLNNPPEPDLGKVTGPSSEHFGPGHQGAKVFHKCYNCGVDNDISRHFRKDAVYRMG
ncbi:hypothetical protein G7054_g4569 [Neopestalotiopsis clavispora]|nr:hypothetical protein G7054_g4569 [Neopestalotiopsis clavispora]